jgi:hypothetical protein
MEWVSGNVFIRPNVLENAGEYIDGHTHNFDHTSIVFTGAVRVTQKTPDGNEFTQEFHAPAHFLVKANYSHLIEALEDKTVVWCVYSHRNAQGDVIEQNPGWMGAYF